MIALGASCSPAPLRVDLAPQPGERSALVFALPGTEAVMGGPFATVDLATGQGASCFDGQTLGSAPLTLTALYYRRPPAELCFAPGCGQIGSGPTARRLPEPDRVGVQEIDVETASAAWRATALPPHLAGLEVQRSCRSPASPAVEIRTGGRFSLVRLADGTVWSFGLNDLGQLGLGDTEPRSVPTRVPLNEPALAISAYLVQACALLASGKVVCWGQADGFVGTGRRSTLSPTEVGGLGAVKQIAVGRRFACALEEGGRLACWGLIFPGEGVFAEEAITVGTATDAWALRAGGYHACVLGPSGLRCFGSNDTAQCGTPTTSAKVLGELTRFQGPPDIVEVALGEAHTVVRTAEGRVYFVGYNKNRETVSLEEVPQLRGATALSAQGFSSCALLDAAAECWGFLIGGAPTRFHEVVGVTQLSVGPGSHPSGTNRGDGVGPSHVCGIDDAGALLCGGGDAYGQLGDGQNPMTADGVRPLW